MNSKKSHGAISYKRTKMQKDLIIQKLKENGCRITKQRLIILDTILDNECSCSKEIHYRAARIDPEIGRATVYRMINLLEEIGAISRKSMYRVVFAEKCSMDNVCTIVLDDEKTYHLSAEKWNSIVKEGLKAHGYLKNQNISMIEVNICEAEA